MENLGKIRTGLLRGGSWYFFGWWVRAATRGRARPVELDDSLGFRLVLVREKTNGE